ncbi:MAG: PadR family transcriptional regulator [Acidobacteria bacterium]|nr:PadR family transcriptional regulator [Acidobacteriota bacterium]
MENKITQLRKGILELAILGVLSRGAHYGYSLGRLLAGDDTIDLKEGTIYPLLSRLAKEGLVRTRWVESREGPPRKYYELTVEGERVFKALIDEFRRLESLVDRSLHPACDATPSPCSSNLSLAVETESEQRSIFSIPTPGNTRSVTSAETTDTPARNQAPPFKSGENGDSDEMSVPCLPCLGEVSVPQPGEVSVLQVSVPQVVPRVAPRHHPGTLPDTPEEHTEIPKEDRHES